MSKPTKIIGLLGLLTLISLGFSLFCVFRYFNSSGLEVDQIFYVRAGDSFPKVVQNLANQGLIANEKVFLYGSKLMKKNKISVKKGEYFIEKKSTPLDILNKLLEGQVYYRKVTFAEGLTTHSILEMIDSLDGLEGEITMAVAEGELLPETYLYTRGETKNSFIGRMRAAMERVLDEHWESRSPNLPIKTKREALILASIVEKETGVPEERGRVASVFVNRLNAGWRLQSDPTVVYAFTKGDKNLEREIRRSDLDRESEYNTYQIYGLPPAPIANPGRESIKATLNPDRTEYMFFVATGSGGHNFACTLEEHNYFVKQYRKSLKK